VIESHPTVPSSKEHQPYISAFSRLSQFLPKGYTAQNVVEGKRAAREELRKR
jgi:hypothetical protein